MKFEIKKEELVKSLSNVVRVIENKGTMPILSNVLISVSDVGNLSITSTDLEIQIISRVQLVLGFVAGSIAIPGKKLFDICKSLPANSIIKISMVESGNKISIISGKSKFSLSCLPSDNYPEFKNDKFDKKLSINSFDLKKAIDKTLFSMANGDVRYYLNGLSVNCTNRKLKIVASDGHRMAIYDDIKLDCDCEDFNIIIPRKAAIELSKLLYGTDDIIVELSNNGISFCIDNIEFSAKLVDSKYPDFGKVFQQEFFNPIHVQKQILKEALTRVAILSNEKFKGVTFDITPESLKISTHNPEHDEAEEELLIEYAGEPLAIAFNAQYLLDAVSNLDSELAVLTIASNASSCFIDEPNDCGYKFIVMPVRI